LTQAKRTSYFTSIKKIVPLLPVLYNLSPAALLLIAQ